MVLQHKYFIRKHYVQVPYAVNVLSKKLEPILKKVKTRGRCY